jgi:hypothetical protein
VLHVEISPNYSYIGYCKKESDWLLDSQCLSRCFLDETFRVERQQPGYSKKFENVLQLVFKGYQLDLGFDSMTKLDQWLKALSVTSGTPCMSSVANMHVCSAGCYGTMGTITLPCRSIHVICRNNLLLHALLQKTLKPPQTL